MSNSIQELSQKISENPTAELYLQRGRAYFNAKKYDLALSDFDEGLKLEPKHMKCYYMRIYTLTKQKLYEKALSDCEDMLASDPNYSPAYCGKAIVYSDQKRHEKALAGFTKAIELNPSFAYPYNGRGNIYCDQKRYKDALEEYTKAIKLEPALAYPLSNRGNTYYDQNRYDEALSDFTKAIELEPTLANLYNDRGRVYHSQKRFEEALTDYSKAIELNPVFAYPFYNCGIVHYEHKHYEEALADFSKAYELFGEEDEYYKSIAQSKISELEEVIKTRKEKEKDRASAIIEKTEKFSSKIEKNEQIKSGFYSYNQQNDTADTFSFTVLRKWNSFTPIVGMGFRSSKGGGYFIKCGDKGIVIDPGFNFIENFMANGYTFSEIDAVLITHAHNDHTADLDSLLTMLHKYNDDLFGGDLNDPLVLPKDGSILADVLKDLNIPTPISSADMVKVKEEMDERFPKVVKNITFYITSGTFKKYSGFFNLKKISNYKVVCVDCEHYKAFQINDGLKVRVIKAKHDDIMSDITSVGFCFEQEDFVLIYTGDTGFWGMREEYAQLEADYSQKNIVLVANMGGFKRSEISYSKNNDVEKHYYKNHLGRLGLAKLVEIIKPELCIITEFGEEFDGGYRKKIADIFNEVYQKELKTTFLPADIGLRVKRNQSDSKTKVEAIISCDDINKKEFIDPTDVRVDELKPISQIYYYHKDIDAVELGQEKMYEFHKSLR